MQPLTWPVCSFHLLPSVSSSPPPLPSFPSSLSPYLSQAKVDNEIIDYRDLAAIPRVKAIYDIEHPDMISYKCVNGNSSTLDNRGNRQGRQSPAEVTSCATMQVHTHWHVCVSLTWNPVVLVWLVAPHQTRIERLLETNNTPAGIRDPVSLQFWIIDEYLF